VIGEVKRLTSHTLHCLGLRRSQPAVKTPEHYWSIGILAGPNPFSLQETSRTKNPVLTHRDVSDVRALFVADPFMVHHDGTWHMFFEAVNADCGRGEIGLASSADGFDWVYEKIVLKEPFHLSYPYVFEAHGEYYLIPETHEVAAVRLYKAEHFPDEWRFVGDLLSGQYFADTSVAFCNDRWWLFTETSRDMKHDTLDLYHASDLQGPWHKHPASPVVSGNPHDARPAGRLTQVNGALVRYAQDCFPIYGTQVRAFEVTELSPDRYGERPWAHNPILAAGAAAWNRCGMHHLDPHRIADNNWIACVDGFCFEP
jgi:hypothetical protein